MSTAEKLLVQIFERKKRIIEQIKQQTKLFDHHLVSKCLLDGFAPPPFLFPSQSSELNRDEIISGLLLPRHQPASVFSASIYPSPVINCHNEGLTNDSCTNVCVLSKDGRDGLNALLEVSTSCVPDSVDEVPELESTLRSPQDHIDAREMVLQDCTNQCHSVRIQRSRSRQRALEIRNSAKANKIHWSSDDKGAACSSQFKGSGSNTLECENTDDLELAKPVNENNGNLTENGKRMSEFSNDKNHKNVCCDIDAAARSSFHQSNGNNDITVREHGLTESCRRLLEQVDSTNELTEKANPPSILMFTMCAAQADIGGSILEPEGSTSHPRPNEETFGVDNCSIFSKEEAISGLRDTSKSSEFAPSSGRMKKGRSGIQFNLLNECHISSHNKDNGGSRDEQIDHVNNFKEPANLDENCQVRMEGSDFQHNEQGLNSNSRRVLGSKGCSQEFNNVKPVSKSCMINVKDTNGSLVGSLANLTQPFQGNNPKVSSVVCPNIVSGEKISDAVVVDTDGVVGHCSAALGVNCGGSDTGEGVLTQYGRQVNPKQLDFDDVEGLSLNEATGPASTEQDNLSVERIPVDMLDKEAFVHQQAKASSSSQMPLQEEQHISCLEEKAVPDSSETHTSDCLDTVDEIITSPSQQKRKSSSPQNQNVDSHVMASWPQHKRRKTENQHANSVFATPRLATKVIQHKNTDHVEDAVETNFDKKEVEDMQLDAKNESEAEDMQIDATNGSELSPSKLQNVEDAVETNFDKKEVEDVQLDATNEPKTEDMQVDATNGSELSPSKLQNVNRSLGDKSRNTVITSTPKQQGFPLEAKWNGMNTRTSPVRLLNRPEVVDPTITDSIATEQKIEEKTDALTNPENINDEQNTEVFTFSGKTIQEKKSHPRENSITNCSVNSPTLQAMDIDGSNQNIPEFESFVMETDDMQPCISGSVMNFDKLVLPDNALERASVLERLCKSACIETPLSNFTATYRLHETPILRQSVPDFLTKMELRSTDCKDGKHPVAGYNCFKEEIKSPFHEWSHSESLAIINAQSAWDIKKPSISPPGKFWDGTASKSGNSGERASSIPELPCISEENENAEDVADTFQQGICSASKGSFAKRDPLADITVESNLPSSVCKPELPDDRCSLASLSTEYSITDTCSKPKQKIGKQTSNRRHISKAKENHNPSLAMNGVTKVGKSLRYRSSKPPKSSVKSSLNKEFTGPAEWQSKHINIVSNVTSFIPFVQQKKAAAVITGKRDVKVKALEAAEAAKRLAEKKENERKMKKEALKLERAKIEEQNLRQLELEKEKKAEERKKKEAEMAAKKRQREEEEKREKERKRKRVEETRRQQLAHEEKLRAEKQNNQIKRRHEDEIAHDRKDVKDKAGKEEETDKAKKEKIMPKVSEAEPRGVSKAGTSEEHTVGESHRASSYGNSKMEVHLPEAAENDQFVSTVDEPSYDISPYKGSDDEDEDEDEDEIPDKKFVPSWASKKSVAADVASQQSIDPMSIFPPESFCNIIEDVLQRRLAPKVKPRQKK